jgi:hypothetical protein
MAGKNPELIYSYLCKDGVTCPYEMPRIVFTPGYAEKYWRFSSQRTGLPDG